ncbi:MAG: serine/threonine protein kinase [Anaerolineae bacterium]|nr:serine/threonine protein kinase [Anaerolineae bacterium]
MGSKQKQKLWKGSWQLIFPETQNIGAGGQGVVRKVQRTRDGKTGALKELINFNNPERRKRMHIEATSLSVLDHPNIAHIIDENTTSEGQLYIITEFIDGPTLEEQISSCPFSLEEVLAFAERILDALHHAHSVGVFHRDIKPENIILRHASPADPVLVDFGISFNDEERLFSAATFMGQQLGNRFLHLPELQRGARDPRSDLTQFCGVALYTITQQQPISLKDEEGRMPHQQSTVREKLAEAIPNNIIRGKLLRLFDRAFQNDLTERWQTAKELASAFERMMFEPEVRGQTSLSAIRTELEGRPGFNQQMLMKRLYLEFMNETRQVLNEIRQELGEHIASVKQGGAHENVEESEFGSRFGITIPGDEVYLKLHGKVVGNELIMRIEEDDTLLARLDLNAPNWEPYQIGLEEEIGSRLSRKLQET